MSVHILKNGYLESSAPACHSRPSATPQPPRKGAALRLVSTNNMERDDWLEVRRTGIGSSDAAGRCCINQFQGELPQTQPWLCHGRRLRTAQFCKSI